MMGPSAASAAIANLAAGGGGGAEAGGSVPNDKYHEQKLSIKLLSIDAQARNDIKHAHKICC